MCWYKVGRFKKPDGEKRYRFDIVCSLDDDDCMWRAGSTILGHGRRSAYKLELIYL